MSTLHVYVIASVAVSVAAFKGIGRFFTHTRKAMSGPIHVVTDLKGQRLVSG
jgi:hypothetical protein